MKTSRPEALERTAQILARSDLDAWEIFFVQDQGLGLAAKNGRIETISRSEEAGLAIRAVYETPDGSQVGSAYSHDLAPAALAETVEKAQGLARLSSPEPHLNLAPPPDALPQVETVDSGLAAISQEEKARLVLEMEAAGLEFDPRVVKVRRAAYQENATQTWLGNSLGADLFRERTLCQVAIMLLASQDGESQMGYDLNFSPLFGRLEPTTTAQQAAALAVGLLGAGRAETGGCPVVFSDLVAAEMLSVLAPAFLAENVQKGKSLIAGRMGRKIFSEKVTLIDDGLYPLGAASRPFDDEGTPQQTTEVVRAGKVSGLLYDRLAAAKEGVGPTGNATRSSAAALPASSATNFYLKPDVGGPEKLVDQVDSGLLVREVMGLHTVDSISGDFSLGAAGQWIEDGQPVRPVAGAAISGNLIELMDRVIGVGEKVKFVGRVGSPSLLVEKLDVAG